MESLTAHSLNYELPAGLHLDKYAQQILENSRTPNLANTTTIALVPSSSLIASDVDSSATTTSEFFKKIGATLIHSIQLQSLPRANTLDTSLNAAARAASASTVDNMELEFGPHHLVMDPCDYDNAMDELQKQLDYDKFMNEVWIGVVLTLILISMIFCFCSCFLYHQFRVWKRNYRTTVTQTSDTNVVKLNLDVEDPVPEYTLVSGLPSYEAALELLHKNPNSCVLVHPSALEVFNKNEKCCNENITERVIFDTNGTNGAGNPAEVSVPLLSDSSNNHNIDKSTLPCYNETTTPITSPTTSSLTYNHSLVSLLSLATQITSQCKTKSAANETEKQFKV